MNEYLHSSMRSAGCRVLPFIMGGGSHVSHTTLSVFREMDEAASTDEAFADYVENVDGNESDSECEDEVRAHPHAAVSHGGSIEILGRILFGVSQIYMST